MVCLERVARCGSRHDNVHVSVGAMNAELSRPNLLATVKSGRKQVIFLMHTLKCSFILLGVPEKDFSFKESPLFGHVIHFKISVDISLAASTEFVSKTMPLCCRRWQTCHGIPRYMATFINKYVDFSNCLRTRVFSKIHFKNLWTLLNLMSWFYVPVPFRGDSRTWT